MSGRHVLACGKHAGRTFDELWDAERGYCEWAAGNASYGRMVEFAAWCREKLKREPLRLRRDMNVTDVVDPLACNDEFMSLLPSFATKVRKVHDPVARPPSVTAAVFGTFLDYMFRHHLCSRQHKPCDDHRAKIVSDSVQYDEDNIDEDELPPDRWHSCMLMCNVLEFIDKDIVEAYRVFVSTPDTRAVLGDVFTTSLAHAAFFARDVRGLKFDTSMVSDAHVNAMLAYLDTLPTDKMECDPTFGIVGLLKGDGDLLCGDVLVDFKASATPPTPSSWVQLLLYATLWFVRTGDRLREIRVYNPLLGEEYNIDISGWDGAPRVEAFLRKCMDGPEKVGTKRARSGEPRRSRSLALQARAG